MKITLPAITPGEWAISKHLNGERYIYPDWVDDSIVGDYKHGVATYICVCEDAEEKEANQNAISALPELLDAVKLAFIHATHCTDPTVTETLKSALLKAGVTIED